MDLLAHFQHQLRQWPTSARYWLGFSGGLDSTVLAHLAYRTSLQFNAPSNSPSSPESDLPSPDYQFALCHVHHGLQPAADAWADRAQALADEWQWPCQVHYVDLQTENMTKGQGIEAVARQARYAVWTDLLAADETLLLGHHANDQVETVLQRWCRGAGSKGLAGIPARRVLGNAWLQRPLLNVSQDQLLAYAQHHQLQWIDDPSNDQVHYDRNFLRHEVIPKLQQRWPQLVTTMSRNAHLQAETAELLAVLAEQDCAQPMAAMTTAMTTALHWAPLRKLSPARQRNALLYWLQQQAKLSRSPLAQPNYQQLVTCIDSVADARTDAEICHRWGADRPDQQRTVAYFWREHWYCYAQANLEPPGRDCVIDWLNPEVALPLPYALGQLQPCPSLAGLSQPLQVRFRQGGERLRLKGRTQRLKTLLLAAGVMPWLRDLVPLVYAGETLVAVADVLCSDPCYALPDYAEQPLVWQPEFNWCRSHDLN